MNFFLSSKTFSYYIPQIWLQVKKIQPLLFAQGSCLKERIGRQIRGASWTNSWEVACHFEYNFLNFDHQFFLSSKRCTSDLPQIWLQVRKINPYYLHKVAALKKIWRQIRGAPWKNIHPKYLLLIYHKFDYKLEKSTLIICTRWLKEKISRQIKGVLCKNTWEVACYFEYKFLNFDNQCFLIIQKMYYLYTTNLITSKKKSTLIICTRWLP